jgi:Rieske Fe-S protein
MSQSDSPADSAASRRNFFKGAAMAAGAAAIAAPAAAQTAAPAESRPTVPAEITNRAAAPLPTREFPMTGADVFARACKAEGLSALFCCPGNYEVIHAIAEQGIPAPPAGSSDAFEPLLDPAPIG